MQIREIATLIGCPRDKVRLLAKHYGLTLRDGRAGRVLPTLRTKIDVTEATRLYVEHKWSCEKIGERFGCHGATVHRKLRAAGIKIRHHNDTKRGAKARNRIDLDFDAVISRYSVPYASMSAVGRSFGVSSAVVRRILIENDVEIKPQRLAKKFPSGREHPRWRHDLTDHEREHRRDINAQSDWRLQVLERDHYTCQRCDASSGARLNAHHIEPHYRARDSRWDVSNGMTLCVDCHRQYHRTYGFKRANRATLAEFLCLFEQQAA